MCISRASNLQSKTQDSRAHVGPVAMMGESKNWRCAFHDDPANNGGFYEFFDELWNSEAAVSTMPNQKEKLFFSIRKISTKLHFYAFFRFWVENFDEILFEFLEIFDSRSERGACSHRPWRKNPKIRRYRREMSLRNLHFFWAPFLKKNHWNLGET